MAMLKTLYKPLGLLISVAGGITAGAVFTRVWTLATDQDDASEATDQHRNWREVLVAAGVQGAVFGVVALDRGGAAGFRKVTGYGPVSNPVPRGQQELLRDRPDHRRPTRVRGGYAQASVTT